MSANDVIGNINSNAIHFKKVFNNQGIENRQDAIEIIEGVSGTLGAIIPGLIDGLGVVSSNSMS